eukprot:1524234-Alexandrium_andersonii.AAC.1
MQLQSPFSPMRRSADARVFEPIGARGQTQRPATFVVPALLHGKTVPFALRGSGASPAPGSFPCLRWAAQCGQAIS